MRRVRENILVSKGDLPVFPVDSEVFSCPAGQDTVTCNVLPGQLVMYDPKTNISTGITPDVSTYDTVVMGVGWDSTGNGTSDTIRKGFGEKMYGNYINAATAEPPRCGVAEIHDILFKCTDCQITYTIQINVEDDQSQNQFPYNRPASYVFSAVSECCDCDDCGATYSADTLACALVDKINGGLMTSDPTKISTFKKPLPQNLPFYAVRLFAGATASQVWCLAANADACGNGCTTVGAIWGMTIDGGAEIPFTNNLNPNDPTQTMQGQLSGVIAQINAQLGINGAATMTSGAGDCCEIQLEINSCHDVALLSATATDIPPCGEDDPLLPVNFANECGNCTPGTTDKTFEAGIRIIAKEVDLNCNCQFPPNPPKGYFGRKLTVHASEGFACGSTYVRKTQPMELPQNLGYQWQWRDYTSNNGGSGRRQNPYNDQYGPINLPGVQDRAGVSAVDCKKDYCSYILDHGLPHTNNGVSSPFRIARGRTVILIPSADAVTIAEWEALMNTYITSASTPTVKLGLTCASDQDQIETALPGTIAYPNANGYLV